MDRMRARWTSRLRSRKVMRELLTHPLVLRGLHLLALSRAFVRYRNPRRRRAGMHHQAFHARAWRAAASELGASYKQLRSGIAQIEFKGRYTRVNENVCEIDNPITLAVLHDKPLIHEILQSIGLPV